MRRSLAIILTGGLLLLGSLALAMGTAAATIGSTTTCNNALGNGGAVCEVTVVNTVTTTGGSALVTVRECQGSAGVPDATCTNTTTALAEPVTAVTQCDGSINGGGGTLRCSVVVTNNYVGMSPVVTPVTVNQCVGSSDMGSVLDCSPFPATTIGATITQCNGSANGGGSTLTCTATGTESSAHAVTINQCNGSANGGGTSTTCSASITNQEIAGPTPTPTPTPTPATTPTPGPTPTPSTTPAVTPTPMPTPIPSATPTVTPSATAGPVTPPTTTPVVTAPPTDTQPEADRSASGSTLWVAVAILVVAVVTLLARVVRGAIRAR